jgi:hypothetical protein
LKNTSLSEEEEEDYLLQAINNNFIHLFIVYNYKINFICLVTLIFIYALMRINLVQQYFIIKKINKRKIDSNIYVSMIAI